MSEPKSKQQSGSTVNTQNQPTRESSKGPREVGGRKDGLEPTRYGDWEKNGRCIDF